MPAPPEKRFPISLSHRLPLPFVMAIVLCAGIASLSHAQAADKQQNLDRLMQRFPDADANKDGKLTIEEAKAYNAAHPDLRRNRQADGKGEADGKGKADGEGEATVSAQVLARVETYRKIDSTELKLWIFGESDPKAKKPAIVFFFGGSWNSGSPDQFENQARHFASRGMIAITPDYRVRSRQGVQVVECVKDAKAAIAWVRENAQRLGIDPDKIAASGGSAGGHLAASTGTISGFGSDERPNAMILFNPACTLAPIEGWQPSGIRPGQLSAKRFGVEAQVISPAHHIGPHTPPTLILHGKADTTVPYASVVAFESAMKQAGRPCKLVGYDGAEHGFFNRGEYYSKTLAEADGFLVDLGWIKK
jgi:acetyl esterase/lipase